MHGGKYRECRTMDFSWEVGKENDFREAMIGFLFQNLSLTTIGTTMDCVVNYENETQSTETEGSSSTVSKPWSPLKQPVYAVALLAAAYVVVAILGVVNNTMVIVVICRQVKLRTVTNCFLANLAIADVLVCIFVLPITLLDNIYTEWWYGGMMCKAAPYLQGVSVSASVNTLAAVSVERYMAIFSHKSSKMTSRCAALVILFIWLVPSLAFIPWILIYDEKTFLVSGYDYVTCHADWSDPWTAKAFTVAVVFLTCYFIPLSFIAVFCLLIGVRVWRRRVRGLLGPRTKRNILRTKTKVLKMLVVVVVLFALSWLPLYVIVLRNLFGPPMTRHERALVRKYLSPIAQWLGAANSCVNPFIYCYYSSNFRSAVRQLLHRTARPSGSVSTTR